MALEKRKAKSPPATGCFIGCGVFFLSFAVYLATLAPTVTSWDSGELILGAVAMGNPHPPAYPLFCILGKGFSFIPLGNAAYRVNLVSATFAAAAIYLLYRLVLEMGSGRPGFEWAAAGLALSFAFIQNYWGISVISEVYALNAFLLVGTAYLMLLYDKCGRDSFLHASAFLVGLALVNHQSALMFIPAYVAYHLIAKENYKNPGKLLQSLFFFLLGYSVILYLPVRASASPVINVGDPRDLAGFIWSVKWKENITMVEALAGKALRGMSGPGLLYIAAGLAACAAVFYFLRKKSYLLMLTLSALLYFVGTTMLTAPAAGIRKWGLEAKFFVPVYLFAGLAAVAAVLMAWAGRPARKAPGVAGTVFIAVSCLLFPIGVMAYNYGGADNSRNFFAYDFASNTLKSVRQDAAVFAWGDNGVFPVWYLQGAEHYRDDVFFIHTDLLTYPWYMEDRRAGMEKKYGVLYVPPLKLTYLKANLPIMRLMLEKATPTYFDFSAAQQLDYKIELFKPQGLVHLAPTWEALPLGDIWNKYVLRGAFDNTTDKAFAAEGILDIYAWECAVWAQDAYTRGRNGEALEAYELARNLGLDNEYLERWAEGIRKGQKVQR